MNFSTRCQASLVSFIIILSIFSNQIKAQLYPLSTEVWSEPVKIDTFAQLGRIETCGSFTQNLDTIYLYIDNAIYTSYLDNNIWTTPQRLDDTINDAIVKHPSISKDSKRLYFSAWGGYGGWDLWYSDWDQDIQKWSAPENMGSVINSEGTELYLYELSRDSIITVNSNWGFEAPGLYVRQVEKSEWCLIDSFYYHPIGGGHINGLSVTKNQKKLYFSRWSHTWPDLDERSTELCVCYWDSNSNYWSDPYFLNINTKSVCLDSLCNTKIRGSEIYPWISNDGKTLIFSSNRDAISYQDGGGGLYISKLLYDKDGKPVSVNSNNKNSYKTNVESLLFYNFPNPFNNSTTIKFELLNKQRIELVLFNQLGKIVKTLKGGSIYEQGIHIVNLKNNDYEGISSGVYICQLKGEDFRKSIKILCLN